MKKQKVIVLCGSTRYVQIMAVVGWLLERDEGAIVMGLHLLPWWYPNIENIPDHLAEHEDCKEHCDNLHMRKIDLADEVYVVNKDDYIGNSTRREIEYAQSKGVPLRWFTSGDDKVITAMINEAIREKESLHPGCFGFMPDKDDQIKYKSHCVRCDLAVDCWCDSSPQSKSDKLLRFEPFVKV